MEKAPAKVRPIVNVGNTYVATGQYDLAALYYANAMRVASVPTRPIYEQRTGWAVAAVNLAQMQRVMGQHEDASALLASVRQRFPRFVEAAKLEASWRSGS